MTLRRILAAVAAVLVVLVVFVGGVVVGGHAQATGLTHLSDPLRGFLLGDSGEDLAVAGARPARERLLRAGRHDEARALVGGAR